MKIYYLNLIIFLIVNLFDETLSVDNNLCEMNGKIRPTFAEIFGQKWENEIENDQNDQNSNWQNEQNELNSAFPIDSDLNDHQLDDQQKIETVHKFHAIKERIKKRGKYSANHRYKIEQKIANKFGIYRRKIYEWQQQFGLSQKRKTNQKNYYEKKKREFIERIDEFKRMSNYGKQKQFAKELGIGKETFIKWKKEFGIEMGKNGKRFSNEEKICKMNIYEEIKKGNPALIDKEIAEFLKISPRSLSKWKTKN